MQEVPVVIWGEGEPVVLVHGSGDTDPTFVWSQQRPLAERYQLLVVTCPGYGQRPIKPRTQADVLTHQLGATLAVCPGKGHSIPDTGEPFNHLLESFLHSASTWRSPASPEKGGA